MSEGPDGNDRALAVAAVRGDKRAFEELVLRHKTSLYRFVRRYVGEPDDAYDVVQESFVSAWLALRRFDVTQSFGAWLRKIALNKCRDYGRRKSVRRRLLTLFALENHSVGSMTHEDAQLDPDSDESLRLRLLDQAIADLPRLYKEPLLLTTFSGMTHQDVAVELKTTAKAIEMRIRRAKKRLAEALTSRKSTRPEG